MKRRIKSTYDSIRLLILLHFSFFICHSSVAQVSGDEEKELINLAATRDKNAIKEAVRGWWTASMRNHDQRIKWWEEARFGMFIHWGIYSLPAGEWKGKKISGYAEHLMRKEKISRKEYLELAHRFKPIKFNAEQWVLEAMKAGMRYFIITAKHHDGFAMYDSKISDFDIIDQTSFRRDPMAELAEACKKHGMKFGFYYSHAFDWEHPDAPGNDWEYKNPGGDLNLFGGRNWYDSHPELLQKAIKYVDEKAIPQIRELLLKYHPDILWFDTPHKLPLSENIRILKAIREIDQNVVVNGRLVRSSNANFGDYKNTADRPAEFFPVDGNWEAIPTTNESYGYHRFDSSHKSAAFFIQLIAKSASRGGNLLMNLGPTGEGKFDDKDKVILDGIGKWMKKNGESIYGTTRSSLPLQSWGVSTIRGNKLFLHVLSWPEDGKIFIGGLNSEIKSASYLAETQNTLVSKRLGKSDLILEVPLSPPDTTNTVIVLEIYDSLKTDSIRFISPNNNLHRLLAFDAVQHGQGFSYGDGKADRFFVEGWKTTDQYLSWTFRTIESKPYELLMKFIGEGDIVRSFDILIDDGKLFSAIPVPKTGSGVMSRSIGEITLSPGIHTLKMKAADLTGGELMKLLELQLLMKAGK